MSVFIIIIFAKWRRKKSDGKGLFLRINTKIDRKTVKKSSFALNLARNTKPNHARCCSRRVRSFDILDANFTADLRMLNSS